MFSKIRARLAYDLTISVLGLIALIAITAIFAAARLDIETMEAFDRSFLLETLKLLLTSLLPVLGAWVGTVLAHYYGRETLEAATRLSRPPPAPEPETASVAHVMIPMVSAKTLTLEAGKLFEDLTLARVRLELDRLKDGKQYKRLPVLDAQACCIALIHESSFSEVSRLAGGADDDRTLQTLKTTNKDDVKLQAELAKFTTTIAYIGLKATLSDARSAMARVPGSEDAIVTATGLKQEPAIGWVTNEDLLAAVKIR